MSKNNDMIKLVRLFEATQFAGEPEQKAGDQVRGTDKAAKNGKQHPFHNRLVGEEISMEDKLSKRYQDMKDVQAREKEQKKKEELDKQDVTEGKLNEDLQADDGEYYSNSDKFFGQFEAEHFDNEETSADGMEIRGYIDGVNVMAWRFKSAKKVGGWGIYDDSALNQGVAEGEQRMSRAAKGNEKYGKDGMRALAKAGREGASEKKLDAIRDQHDNYNENVEEASLGAMRDYYAGNAKAQDKSKLSQMRDYFSKADTGSSQQSRATPNRPRTGNIAHVRTVREQDSDNNPVGSAIARRIMMQRTDLLSKYGPVKVMSAIDEVSDFVGDVDEIGSSDVSGWIRHVEQMLGNMGEGVEEAGYPEVDHMPGKRGIGLDSAKTTDTHVKTFHASKEKEAHEFAKKNGYIVKKHVYPKSANNSQPHEFQVHKNEQGVAEAEKNPHTSALGKALHRDLSKEKKASPAQVEKNKARWAQRQADKEQGVAEGVAETMTMDDAVKVLRQYGAGHFKTTTNELHFYKNGRPFSVDLIFNDDATRSVSLSQLNAAGRRLKGQGIDEASNPTDKITVDVPLMIRIMEYAREDAQDDMDLHNVAEQLVRLSAMGKTLGMNDYDGIVGQTTEQKLSELGAVPPTPPTAPTPPATANSAATSGSVSPDEQTALNKIQTNPAMKQQFDKLMTQATPGAAAKPAALDPAQADALEKLKTNAGLKSQYDRLIKQANPAATP